MKPFAALALWAAAALAAPSDARPRADAPCTPGSYRCDADGTAIDVCDAQGAWLVAGACPDDTVCRYLPQNGFRLPFCVHPPPAAPTAPAAKRDDQTPPPPPCQPATYLCASNPGTGASGIEVCDTQSKWEYVGDCPKDSHCEYFPSGIPYCVDN